MAVTSSARAGGATVVTPVAVAAARPKSANHLILLLVLLIVILLGDEGDGAADSSRRPCLHFEPIPPGRSDVAQVTKCDETVTMGGSRVHTAGWSWTDTARVALESVLVVRPPRQAAVVGMSRYGLRGAAWRLPQ